MKPLNITSQLSREFPVDGRYLVGVSGGRDSVALLHWLINLGYKKLVICHLDHRLRGRSSLTDARFVQKLVDRYNQEFAGQAPRLPSPRAGKRRAYPATRKPELHFELGAANVRTLAAKRRTSIETAAREARYNFFAETARRQKCKIIFLAHHADDLVETFLMNLFRGSGTAGLSGMREASTRSISGVELTLVRPLLGVWRKEIDVYVREHRIKFREDASNKNLNPLRNRIRHRVIPYLEKILGRNIRPVIWRAAAIAGEEEKWMDGQLPASSDVELSVAQLRPQPPALQRRAIFKWLRAQNISEVGFDLVERVRSLLDPSARVAKINLAHNRHARRRAGKIFVE
ncbi:MAG: tRNA lysidine(34) synthetase TilS [Verrucomicrobia bacterium]|nr:tRNA lysidine(34) synthetase TilS [Verrucomicrobiota bacterium]